MTKWELERMEFLIKQAKTGTYIGLGPSDAEIIERFIKPFKDQRDWEKSLAEVAKALKEG